MSMRGSGATLASQCHCGNSGALCIPCLEAHARHSRAIANNEELNRNRDERLLELNELIAQEDEKALKTRLAAEARRAGRRAA